jgi:hypothetical protein
MNLLIQQDSALEEKDRSEIEMLEKRYLELIKFNKDLVERIS